MARLRAEIPFDEAAIRARFQSSGYPKGLEDMLVRDARDRHEEVSRMRRTGACPRCAGAVERARDQRQSGSRHPDDASKTWWKYRCEQCHLAVDILEPDEADDEGVEAHAGPREQ